MGSANPLSKVRPAFLAVLLAAMVLLPAIPARAAIIPVTKTADTRDGTCDGDCSLREAIDKANADAGPDEITLPAGEYKLTRSGAEEDLNDVGDLDISEALTFSGAGSATTVIDGNGVLLASRVLDISAGDLTVMGATIRGGSTSSFGAGIRSSPGGVTLTNVVMTGNHSTSSFAGGVFAEGDVTLTDVTFSDNTADTSGGAVSTDGALTATRASFTNNHAGSYAGAIYASDGVTLTDVTFSGHTAETSGAAVSTDGALTATRVSFTNNHAGSYAGAIYTADGVTLTDATVSGNTAETSGGAVSTDGALVATRASFMNNHASSYAGAIYTADGVTLTDVTVSGNSAADSAGAVSTDAGITATNLTLSGNSAGSYGGGLYSADGGTFNNATIVGNTADSDGDGSGDGGGILVDSPVTVTNSILAGNSDLSPATKAPDCAGEVTSGGQTILGTSTGCTFTPGPGDKPGVDPMLGPLGDNGGPLQTHPLLPGSPAIDAGSTLRAASDVACSASDARGVSRDLGGGCDIGAYELVKCLGTVVNRVGTTGDDTLTGTSAGDGFLAFEGNDALSGLGGKDRLCAGPGNDKLRGGSGADRLRGEAGKDVLRGGGGNDRHIGGSGKDTCIGGGGKKDRGTSCKKERGIP